MPAPPARLRIAAAFAVIYLVWGSTYIAIRFAIESLPPLVMAGVRFATAGTLMVAWSRWRGAPAPRPEHWRSATIVGGLLLLGGNGAVSWSELRVASGLAALVIATVPLWIVVLQWLSGAQRRLDAMTVAGIVVGLAGVGLLVGPSHLIGGPAPDPVGVGVLVAGALSWSVGSLYSRRARLPASVSLAAGMQMLCGGLLLVAAGLVTGEGPRVHFDAMSPRSALALAYLVVFGSLAGYSSYLWLLRVVQPRKVATYAFVNPAVAVSLGWWLGGEALAPRTLLATAVIVAAVALITQRKAEPAPATRRG